MASIPSVSVPLVVRVKRAADEEPLDVIRLCPPRSKLARGVSGSFSLQNLQFKHAGTISDKNNLSSRTAELIDNEKTSAVPLTIAPSHGVSVEIESPSVSSDSGVAIEGPIAENPLGTLKRNHRMYMIAKSFRPVSTTDLDDILDPWTRFFADDRESQTVAKRKHDEEPGVPGPLEGSVTAKNFVLCDLEAYNEPPQDRLTKKTRRNQPLSYSSSGITCNDVEMVAQVAAQPEFVYDVYMFSPPVEENATENLYTDVYSCMTDLDFILGTNSDNDIGNEVEIESEPRIGNWSEDDDSNDEDNWRNDYPEDETEDSDSNGSGSGSESSEEDNFDPFSGNMYGLDHSYARARHSRKTLDSDNSAESSDKEEPEDDD